MESRGNHPEKPVIAVVPARFASERLPGKMLLPIAGKPLFLHTLERVRLAERVDAVIAAVDDARILEAAAEAGFEAVLTSAVHRSGSDRIAEVAGRLPADSLVINVQGDEPLVNPRTIDLVAEALLSDNNAQMATAAEPITMLAEELLNPNVVKLVTDSGGYARYFSRSPIPFPRTEAQAYGGDLARAVGADPSLLRLFRKHVGIYGYRRDYLLRFASLPQAGLEVTEALEQLRALDDRALIKVVESDGASIGVDTELDYLRVKGIIESGIDVREVQGGDWPDVARVHVASWQGSFAGIVPAAYLDALSVQQREAAFRNRPEISGYTMNVADHAEAGVVGFVDFGDARSANNADAEIYSFYLLPGFQRRGIGTLLFRSTLLRMKHTGVKSLCLETMENSPYRSFYDKMGGKVVGRRGHDIGGLTVPTVIYAWEDVGAS